LHKDYLLLIFAILGVMKLQGVSKNEPNVTEDFSNIEVEPILKNHEYIPETLQQLTEENFIWKVHLNVFCTNYRVYVGLFLFFAFFCFCIFIYSFRHEDWYDSDEKANNMTLNWFTEECFRFYDDNSTKEHLRRSERASQSNQPKVTRQANSAHTLRGIHPQFKTLEDTCNGGRNHSTFPYHGSQEASIIMELNAVYIENRKCASTTIRNLFGTVFDLHHHWNERISHKFPYDMGPFPECNIFNNRTTSLCYSKRQINDLFFFSFVRDPIDRFYSGVDQASKDYKIEEFRCSDIHHHLNILTAPPKCNHNNHLESQAYSLSTPISAKASPADGKKYMIPLDFIGRVENLREDLIRMLKIIEKRNGKNITDAQWQIIEERLNHHENSASERKFTFKTCMTEEINERIKEIYAQDRVCFGY